MESRMVRTQSMSSGIAGEENKTGGHCQGWEDHQADVYTWKSQGFLWGSWFLMKALGRGTRAATSNLKAFRD